MIYRNLSEKIIKASKEYQVISIIGPRQSGKTTLSRKLFKKYSYYNLEDPDIRLYAEHDPREFLSNDKLMIIDEIQRIPDLFSYIQVIVDKDRTRKFVITGSQNFLISEKVSQSLAGRVAIFKLLPLTLQELKNEDIAEIGLNHQILKGFYPKLYSEHLGINQWYNNYIETYLEKDVRSIKDIGNLSLFHKFLKLTAGRTGQIMNVSSLASDSGISPNTAESWLSVLEASFIIYKLDSYSNNIGKRLVKSPKIHFYDSGLVCALLNIKTVNELKNHPLVGNIFESFIASEFIKNNTDRKDYFFLRDKTGREIDLMYQKDGKDYLYEIKYGQTFSNSFTNNLFYYKNIFGEKKVDLNVIYGGKESQKRTSYKIIGWKDL